MAVPELAGTLVLDNQNWHLFEMCVFMSDGPIIRSVKMPPHGAIYGNESDTQIDTGNDRKHSADDQDGGGGKRTRFNWVAGFTDLCTVRPCTNP